MDYPRHATHVLVDPRFISRRSSAAAQSCTSRPLPLVLREPHAVEWALKSTRTSDGQAPRRLSQAASPSRKEAYSVRLMLGDTYIATTARSPHFAATKPSPSSITEQEGLPALTFQNMATEPVRSPAPRDVSGMLYGSATAARPIRRSTRLWNIKPGSGGRGSDYTAGAVVLFPFFRLRRGRLRLHSLLRAVPLAFGASDFSILFSGLPGANRRRRRFLPCCCVPAIAWNGLCHLWGSLLTDRWFACRRPHAMWCLQSRVRAHRTPRCSHRAVPGAMSFCRENQRSRARKLN